MEIGVSILSTGVWSIWNPRHGAKIAKAAGYDFLQVLPVKGFARYYVDDILPVHYIERAWDPAPSLVRALRNQYSSPPKSPRLLNWLLFNKKEIDGEVFHRLANPAFGQQPVEIVHEGWDPGTMLEVHPGLGLTAPQIARLSRQTGVRLVPDLYHIRESGTPQQPSRLGPWSTTLDLTLPCAGSVHVQPQRDGRELQAFLKGAPTELAGMLKQIGQLNKIASPNFDLVVEVNLSWQGFAPAYVNWALRRFRQRVEECL